MKALIIEDEEIIGKVLEKTIRQVDPSIEVLDILPSLKVARRWFGSNAEPDMLFMDIQLSDGVSFDLLQDFQITCPIVFTTAYDEYALRAFKVNGVDYLLKPIDETELKAAIEKCKDIIARKAAPIGDIRQLMQNFLDPLSAANRYKQRFVVHLRNQWMPIPVGDIAFFSREVLNYLHLFSGEKYQVDATTLDDLEEVLDPSRFFRANRQFIINIDSIKSVRPLDNSKLLIRLKEPHHHLAIEISREKAPQFKKWVDK